MTLCWPHNLIVKRSVLNVSDCTRNRSERLLSFVIEPHSGQSGSQTSCFLILPFTLPSCLSWFFAIGAFRIDHRIFFSSSRAIFFTAGGIGVFSASLQFRRLWTSFVLALSISQIDQDND